MKILHNANLRLLGVSYCHKKLIHSKNNGNCVFFEQDCIDRELVLCTLAKVPELVQPWGIMTAKWWQLTDDAGCDTWHFTSHIWHMTFDRWKLTNDSWYVMDKSWHVTFVSFQFTCDIFLVTVDCWYMKCHIWLATVDMWHLTNDSWHLTDDSLYLTSEICFLAISPNYPYIEHFQCTQ